MTLLSNLTDFKCNVATAILTVLIFMLLTKWLLPNSMNTGPYSYNGTTTLYGGTVPLFHTTEFAILVSSLLGYWVNGNIFHLCRLP
jgi:membrane protein insertase Oxa1/YidC/SpoIIIJ